jgi:hypothetical protein
MGLGTIIFHYGRLLPIVLATLFIFRYRFRKPATSKRKKRLRLAGAFIGNALVPLHALIHPHTKYLLAERLDDHAEEEQEADPTDPAQHLQRQLKKIRNGEELDHITTLLR